MEQLFWQNNRDSIFEHRQKSQGFLILSLRATERSVAISRQITRLLHFVRNDNIILVGTDSICAMTAVCYGYKIGFERRDKNKVIYLGGNRE